MSAPDYIEPIVGWRTWLVVREGEGFRLRSVKGVKTPTRRSRVDLAVCLAAVLRAHGGFGTMWFCSEVRSRLGLGVPVFLCFTRAREYQKPLNGAKNGQL